MVRIFVLLSLLCWSVHSHAEIVLNQWQQGAIGHHLSYFQEQEGKLTWQQALQQFQSQDVKHSRGQSISLGIAVKPVWLRAVVENRGPTNLEYRLSVETPWLDVIDTYIVENGNLSKRVSGGDAIPFEQRPMPYRYYAFETEFNPGVTELLIRIETAGPMAIPIHLARVENAQNRDIRAGYEYGVLYGIMFALALYNLVLFFSIRQREYGLYSLYLLGFIANSLSYTGQIHAVFTPDFGPYFQDWTDIFLMITYSVLGLHFARTVLHTKTYAPKLDKFTFGFATIIPIGMILGAIFNSLLFSMALAFLLNTSFAVLFIVLGIKALKAKVESASLFLISSVTAAVCIGISTGAVAGVLPLNDITFKLIEVGMAFEAFCLAVLLTQRFRMAQRDKLIAEKYAQTDELTQLMNRRGFRMTVDKVLHENNNPRTNISMILLDIDRFKHFNDTYGHATGDLILSNVALCINQSIRDHDIAARWGGEEFIICLPETTQQEALLQAEQLRIALESMPTYYAGEVLNLTVSIGVAGTTKCLFNGETLAEVGIEKVINQADAAMYRAKYSGGNQVSNHYISQAELV